MSFNFIGDRTAHNHASLPRSASLNPSVVAAHVQRYSYVAFLRAHAACEQPCLLVLTDDAVLSELARALPCFEREVLSSSEKVL
jgi:hypothetical protein